MPHHGGFMKDRVKNTNKKSSVGKKVGDALERVGEKIYETGDKLEHKNSSKRSR